MSGFDDGDDDLDNLLSKLQSFGQDGDGNNGAGEEESPYENIKTKEDPDGAYDNIGDLIKGEDGYAIAHAHDLGFTGSGKADEKDEDGYAIPTQLHATPVTPSNHSYVNSDVSSSVPDGTYDSPRQVLPTVPQRPGLGESYDLPLEKSIRRRPPAKTPEQQQQQQHNTSSVGGPQRPQQAFAPTSYDIPQQDLNAPPLKTGPATASQEEGMLYDIPRNEQTRATEQAAMPSRPSMAGDRSYLRPQRNRAPMPVPTSQHPQGSRGPARPHADPAPRLQVRTPTSSSDSKGPATGSRPQRPPQSLPPGAKGPTRGITRGTDDPAYDEIRMAPSEPARRGSASALPPNHCALCKKKIDGPSISALGLLFHEDHFQCIKCEKSLASQQFHKHQGMPFCSSCFQSETAPKCNACHKPITVTCVRAFGHMWHQECLRCDVCNTPLGGAFFQIGNHISCESCHSKSGYKCARCGELASESVITALNKYWHDRCFTCKVCMKAFPDRKFFDIDGEPYCSFHFHEKKGVLCDQCKEPIVGGFVSALGKKFHRDHFNCNLCHTNLASSPFRERNGQPFCGKCYLKMFGSG